MSAPRPSQSTQQLNLGNKPGKLNPVLMRGVSFPEGFRFSCTQKISLHCQDIVPARGGRVTLPAPSFQWARSKAPWAQSDCAAVRGLRLPPQHSRALPWTRPRACFPHSSALVTAQHISSVHQLSAAVTDSAKYKYYDLKKTLWTEQILNHVAKALRAVIPGQP